MRLLRVILGFVFFTHKDRKVIYAETTDEKKKTIINEYQNQILVFVIYNILMFAVSFFSWFFVNYCGVWVFVGGLILFALWLILLRMVLLAKEKIVNK